jgi:hypothetical protein
MLQAEKNVLFLETFGTGKLTVTCLASSKFHIFYVSIVPEPSAVLGILEALWQKSKEIHEKVLLCGSVTVTGQAWAKQKKSTSA